MPTLSTMARESSRIASNLLWEKLTFSLSLSLSFFLSLSMPLSFFFLAC